jgi:hypothetical protein
LFLLLYVCSDDDKSAFSELFLLFDFEFNSYGLWNAEISITHLLCAHNATRTGPYSTESGSLLNIFEILPAVTTKTTLLWDVTLQPCRSLLKCYRTALLPSSRSKSKPSKQPARNKHSTLLPASSITHCAEHIIIINYDLNTNITRMHAHTHTHTPINSLTEYYISASCCIKVSLVVFFRL